MVDFNWDNLFRFKSKHEGLREQLKQNVLFQDLSMSELTMIEEIVNIRHYRPGEQVFKQGDIGVGMYIILKGKVNLYVEELDVETQNPITTHVASLQKGDFFGEMALAEEDGQRSASAVAHDETTLVGFYKPDLIELGERNPIAGVKVLARLAEVLATRLKKTTARITELKREIKNG